MVHVMKNNFKANKTKYIEREGGRMERTQVLLKPTQRRALDQIAKSRNISRSNLLRDMIEDCLRDYKQKQLEEAARSLLDDYENDPELTAFNALDSEDFHA